MMCRNGFAAGWLCLTGALVGCSPAPIPEQASAWVSRPVALCSATLADASQLKFLVNTRDTSESASDSVGEFKSYIYAELTGEHGLLETAELVTATTTAIGVPRLEFQSISQLWNAEMSFSLSRPSGPVDFDLVLTGSDDGSFVGVLETTVLGSTTVLAQCESTYSSSAQVWFGPGKLSDKVPTTVSPDITQDPGLLDSLLPRFPPEFPDETAVVARQAPWALCESESLGLSVVSFEASGAASGAASNSTLIYVERRVAGTPESVVTTHDFYVAQTASTAAINGEDGSCNCDPGYFGLVRWNEASGQSYDLVLERDPLLTPSPSGLGARIVDRISGLTLANDLRCKVARRSSATSVLF